MDKPSFVSHPKKLNPPRTNSASPSCSSSLRWSTLRNPSLDHQSQNSTSEPSDSDHRVGSSRSQCRVPRSPSPSLDPRRAVPRNQSHHQRRASSPPHRVGIAVNSSERSATRRRSDS
ncbi:hypothetical protein F2Q68_00009124 [Brassica cretica]|uniref:Uncharacterized protein n=1 Tax=Brassica cretica TaxID=69181 RepID=A0A3N6REB1_BRACR|nr:hypothetical protein F2Q68_00009124 [Brassica cretica]